MKSDQKDPVDLVESLWRELEQADRAGVFSATEAPRALSDRAGRSSAPQVAVHANPAWMGPLRRRWVGIAAMLGLVVSVWAFLFARELDRLREGRTPGGGLVTRSGEWGEHRFALGCLSGPGGSIDDRCRDFDLDTDGQITLADFGAHQRAMVGEPH